MATDLFENFPLAFTMPYNDGFAITKSDTDELAQVTRAIYVGGAGNIALVTEKGNTITLNGEERDVNILRVGRIALLFQTTDRQLTGRWNNETRAWEELPAGDYRTAVQSAIRVSSGLDAPRIIELPIAAPELAQ